MIVVVEMLNLNMQSVKSYSWKNKHKVLLRSTFLIRLCLILFNEKKRMNKRTNGKKDTMFGWCETLPPEDFKNNNNIQIVSNACAQLKPSLVVS